MFWREKSEINKLGTIREFEIDVPDILTGASRKSHGCFFKRLIKELSYGVYHYPYRAIDLCDLLKALDSSSCSISHILSHTLVSLFNYLALEPKPTYSHNYRLL